MDKHPNPPLDLFSPLVYKWSVEEIFRNLWPFNKFRPPTSLIICSLIVTLIASVTGFLYAVPLGTIIAGILAAQAIIFCSLQVTNYADSIRNTQFDVLSSGGHVYAKLLEKYIRTTFSDSHILIGVALITGTLAHLFNRTYVLKEVLGGINSVLMVFVLILTLGVCYSYGLTVWASLAAFWRSWTIRSLYLKGVLDFYPNFTQFKRLDLQSLSFIGSSWFLIPAARSDLVLLYGVISYNLTMLGTVLASLLLSSSIPRLPSEIRKLLHKGQFIYIAAADPQTKHPHVTPVIFVYDEFHVYFYTSLKAYKYALMRQNKRIALLIPEPQVEHLEKMEMLILEGSVDILGFAKTLLLLPLYIRTFLLIRRKYQTYWRIYRKNSKYLPRAWQVKPFLDRVLLRVRPRKLTWIKTPKKITARLD
ncbi:MAG: pyridoxamine 5'-phosphate oxidase family protein [Candidatus Heimdallarchaeota archaeon]